MALGTEETTTYVVGGMVLATVAMLFLKSNPSSDYRMPISAVATFVVIAMSICASGSLASDVQLPYMINPLEVMSSWSYLFIAMMVFALGSEFLNALLHGVLTQVVSSTKLEANGFKGRLEILAAVDLCVISCNMFTHCMIVSHLVATILRSNVERSLGSFNIINGPVAFVVTVLLNDFFYWCGHAAMHLRPLYPYVHKQHHRQLVPFRGLPDALNIHPLEELIGAGLFGASLWIVTEVVGLHAGTAWVAFTYWSIFNILNHFDRETSLRVPVPFPSGVSDHQMHHRIPKCNYSKLTMLWDRLFGTYLPYVAIGGGQKAEPSQGPRFPASEALPSAYCVLLLIPLLAIAAGISEGVRTFALPVAADALQMVPSFALLTFVALLCDLHRKRYRANVDGATLKAE